jgi:hypothetical protein
VEVTGTWIPSAPRTSGTGLHTMRAIGIRPIKKPAHAYE